jgi:hypothetical protein
MKIFLATGVFDHAISCARFYSRSQPTVIRVFDAQGAVSAPATSNLWHVKNLKFRLFALG